MTNGTYASTRQSCNAPPSVSLSRHAHCTAQAGVAQGQNSTYVLPTWSTEYSETGKVSAHILGLRRSKDLVK